MKKTFFRASLLQITFPTSNMLNLASTSVLFAVVATQFETVEIILFKKSDLLLKYIFIGTYRPLTVLQFFVHFFEMLNHPESNACANCCF